MRILNALLRHLRRFKYFWVIVAFIIVAGFTDENSYMRRYELKQEIAQLEDSIREVEKDNLLKEKQINSLKEDPQEAVKVARELHHMKRDNEDVFYERPSQQPQQP